MISEPDPSSHSPASASRPERRQDYTLWMLRLVPDWRFGRVLCGALILVITLALFRASGALDGIFTQGPTWSVALFFCVILAWLPPAFHYVTERTEQAFDALAAHVDLPADAREHERVRIRRKSATWLARNSLAAVVLWGTQSWVMVGGLSEMWASAWRDPLNFSMSFGGLPVWLSVTCVAQALIGNSRLFARLSSQLVVDPLDPEPLTPVGTMAVSSTLVLIGVLASFPIMWLGGTASPWATIPGAILITSALAVMFVASVWPAHVALREAKGRELKAIENSIRAHRRGPPDDTSHASVAPLLIVRRELLAAREWPLDLGAVTRFGLYMVIVPLTWVGAALIEYLVDRLIDS